MTLRNLIKNPARDGRVRKVATSLSTAVAVTLAFAGCQSQPTVSTPAAQPQALSRSVSPTGPQDADKLLVVDCLLPGVVRKLGNTTYLAPRRPIRTVASECEIRGGEYTLYDRANARTARAVWLPKAKEGDTEAQVYLGEIYEKGLGVPPDYRVAAGWYRKAALQGNTRGAINLGYLYEKGLGVEKNLVEALNWYRKASGLEEDDLAFASNIQATERKLGELEQQLAYSQQEATALRERMESSEKRISKRERELRDSERELAALRKKLTVGGSTGSLPPARDAAEKSAPETTQELQRLRRELREQKTEIRRQRNESQRLQADFERETGRLLTQLEQSRGEQAVLAASLQESRDQLEKAQARLAEARAELESDRGTLAAARAEFEAGLLVKDELQQRLIVEEQKQTAAAGAEARGLRRELQDKEAALSEQRRHIAQLERQLEQSKAGLARAEQRQSKLQSHLGDRETDTLRLRDQLAEARRALNDSSDRLNAQQTRVFEAESELQRLRQELTARQRSQFADETELADLRGRLRQQQRAADRERGEQARLQDAMTERQQALAAEIERLRQRERELGASLSQSIAQSESSNQALADANGRLSKSEQRLADLSGRLTALQDSYARQSARDQASISSLEDELKTKEQALQRERDELAKLKSANQTYREQLAAVEQGRKKLADIGPSIEILDPPIAVTRGGELAVQLRSATRQRVVIGKVVAPAGLLSLTVNDRSEKTDEYDVFRSTIPVAEQKTPVTVVAVDRRGRRAAIDFSLIPQLRQADARKAEPKQSKPVQRFADIDFGNYHALIIGNNQYPHFPDLGSAVNDARQLDSLLKHQYGFKTTLLIDANRYQILSALNDLRARLTPKDNLLIYYAGHGELDRINLRGHWLPVDAEPDSTANWISNIAVTDILNVIAAKHVLVVADSCYSGALTRSSMARISPQTTNENRYKWMKVMNKTRSRTVLTSGGLKPVLDTGSGGHSVFAGAFLKQLRANREILDGYKLFRALVGDVKDAAARFQVEQEPLYAPIKYAGHEAGEFFFVPRAARL